MFYRYFTENSILKSALDKHHFENSFEDGKMPLEKINHLQLQKIFINESQSEIYGFDFASFFLVFKYVLYLVYQISFGVKVKKNQVILPKTNS